MNEGIGLSGKEREKGSLVVCEVVWFGLGCG